MKYALALLFLPAIYAASSDVDALKEFRAICEHDKAPIWGVSLWGPTLLVDPASRETIATQRDPDSKFEERDGFFYGILPQQIQPSNTSIEWGGVEWAMIQSPLPADPFSRIRLLAHESFHRVQKQLDLTAPDRHNAHLDTETGRLWLRMELRALARALRTNGDESRAALKDAMAYRAVRQKLHPSARVEESALEIQEGLPEYTGTVVALANTGESIDRVARATEDFEDQSSFSRSFAYATGPALGLLLDRYASGWRKSVKKDSDLAALLKEAVGCASSPATDRYGYASVAAGEHERETRHQQKLAEYRANFIDGPILQFPKTPELFRNFNPYNLVSLGEYGTVYPTGTFTSSWGKLTIDSVGALLSPDYQSVRVVAPKTLDAPVSGPGWTLTLASGWTIRKSARAGDFEVVRQP